MSARLWIEQKVILYPWMKNRDKESNLLFSLKTIQIFTTEKFFFCNVNDDKGANNSIEGVSKCHNASACRLVVSIQFATVTATPPDTQQLHNVRFSTCSVSLHALSACVNLFFIFQ